MSDAKVRPIPGFDGYFAGDDGNIYRQYAGFLNRDSPKPYAHIQIGKKLHVHPIAWFVARAWVDGYDESRKMRAEHLDGNYLNASPDNLVWVDASAKDPRDLERRSRARVRELMAADPDDPRHGTFTGYRYGCKCERCAAMGPVVNRKNQIKKTLREMSR